MSFAEYKKNVEAGDTVIVYIGPDSIFPVVVEKGKTTQTKYGAMRHDWLIGCKYGGKFNCSKVSLLSLLGKLHQQFYSNGLGIE